MGAHYGLYGTVLFLFGLSIRWAHQGAQAEEGIVRALQPACWT